MGLPQRENRPKLDLLPDGKNSINTDWSEKLDASACQEDFGDVGMNPCNEPVKQRTGKPAVNGWQTEAFDGYLEINEDK